MCLDVARDARAPLLSTTLAGALRWDFKGCRLQRARTASDVGASSERPGLAVLGLGLFKLRIPGFENPTGEMPPREVSQGTNPVVPLVEAGQQVEFPASRIEEDFSALDADFFERFQALRHETGTDHIHAAHALPAEVGQGGRGIGR